MKAWGLLLALCLVPAAVFAEEPDWFDAFRGKAYLQGDTSFIAREKSAAAETPPLFRVRWVVVRYSTSLVSEKERWFWPYRNILLVTMPSGRRYVVESSFGLADEKHVEEERPSQRVASPRAAFEVWTAGGLEDPEAAVNDPCEGLRQKVRAPGGSLDFFLSELSIRTVRATLAEITSASFDADEQRDLRALLMVSPEANPSLPNKVHQLNIRFGLFAVVVAFRNEVPPVQQRTVVLAPDPSPLGDLAAWRAFAHLPLDLPPFVVDPPENPIR